MESTRTHGLPAPPPARRRTVRIFANRIRERCSRNHPRPVAGSADRVKSRVLRMQARIDWQSASRKKTRTCSGAPCKDWQAASRLSRSCAAVLLSSRRTRRWTKAPSRSTGLTCGEQVGCKCSSTAAWFASSHFWIIRARCILQLSTTNRIFRSASSAIRSGNSRKTYAVTGPSRTVSWSWPSGLLAASRWRRKRPLATRTTGV